MLRRSIAGHYWTLFLGAATIAIGGCTDSHRNDGPTGPLAAIAATDDPPPTSAGPSLDEVFMDMAREVPGFAGLYIDSDGTATIQLVDTLRGDAARAAVLQRFTEVAAVRTRPLRIRRANFSFDRLRDWRDILYSAGLPSGIRLVDIDEKSNVLHLGIADPADIASVRAGTLSLGIPVGALRIDVVPEAVKTTQWLTSQVRPTMGGLNIVGDLLHASCTLGFNAKPTGATRYFVANGHCTAAIGTVNGDVFGQPLIGYPLGPEVTDPAFVTGNGCPASGGCRYADAALVRYDTSSVGINYTVAHTTFVYTGSDSTQSGSVQLGVEPFYVVDEMSSASLVSGTALSKVGVSSGWTSGAIGSTCFDVWYSSSTMLRCQFDVTAVVKPGDSGSPVFSYELSTGKAWLAGILWGKLSGNDFIFSPLSGVKTDLGAMTVSKPVF
jgi:hypothetical protein